MKLFIQISFDCRKYLLANVTLVQQIVSCLSKFDRYKFVKTRYSIPKNVQNIFELFFKLFNS